MSEATTMKAVYFPDTDQAVIYLTEIGAGEVEETIELEDSALRGALYVDIDAKGRVLAIDFPYYASKMLPKSLLESAERVRG
jgi:uncharacterized protein YuzE